MVFLKVLYTGIFQAENIKYHSRELDPMIDFRTPRSLAEDLHAGLTSIITELTVEKPTSQSFDFAASTLEDLHNRYDEMVNQTKKDTMQDGNIQFLQEMIARIDQIIAQIELDETMDESGVADSVRKVRALCHSFIEKISFSF